MAITQLNIDNKDKTFADNPAFDHSGESSQNHSNRHGHDHDSHAGMHSHSHAHTHTHDHHSHEEGGIKTYLSMGLSASLLVSGIILEHYSDFMSESLWIKPLWFFCAFIFVGFPVVKEAFEGVVKKDYFNELTLMSIACIGAFCIGDYAEAVGVMLFYCIGETLQDRAVERATRDISKLLEIKSEKARVVKDGERLILNPDQVKVGDLIEVFSGERIPLDGELQTSGGAMFDTSALTGESMPREINEGEEVLAGMISTGTSVRIKVTRLSKESAVSRILDLVRNAQSKKAKSEVFIRKFARIYTPVVTLLAFLVIAVPYFISLIHPFHYVFSEWLYKALVFLVISCPCALVVSVPLSYFAAIGKASRNGILIKGGNYLETLREINVVAFDKTGTLTTGEFDVTYVSSESWIPKEEMLKLMVTAESQSNHPLAKGIIKYANLSGITPYQVASLEEYAGKGVVADINGHKVIVGNLKLLKENGIIIPEKISTTVSTIIALSVDGKFAGYVNLSDTLKEDSGEAVRNLKRIGIKSVVILSGDKKEIIAKYSKELGVTEAFGDMLPADKAQYVENMAKSSENKIAFVGDGMNDSPVLAISNVGVAMGGLGSDVAIESADVVIQTDRPSKIATAIEIAKFTHKIVIENISGALIIKIAILTLGILGYASLWAAVFADVGVAMLAILNSMRVFWMKL